MAPIRTNSRLLLAGLAFAAGITAAADSVLPGASAEFPATFPRPTETTRPWTRWWWLGSAVDEKGIDRMLSQFAQAGEGGVEICPIYGAKGYESRFIKYLSPEWVGMVAHTTEAGKKLGIGVDLTTGTGWPMGGPWITKDLASQGVKLHPSDHATGPYSIEVKKAVQKVKRAAPGGEGFVINPFSVVSLDAFLAQIDRAFIGYQGLAPRAQFHDSFEYYDADWTPDLLEQFEKRRGYRLEDHVDALVGTGNPETVARVRRDYRETLAELHGEWAAHWTEWAHAHGSLSREQAHGAPANLEDVYADADIPETEGDFGGGTDEQIPMMKFASSAAHVKGRTLASSETFTWLGEHYQVSLADLKPVVDRFYLAGINHIFFHGSPYSPEDVPWPGWLFYASVNFGPNGGLWHDLPAFNAYATRVQSILQSGRPDEDVLLYFPFSDYLQTAPGPGERPDSLLTYFKTPGLWMARTDYDRTAMQLWTDGYGYDSVTDDLLAGATVEGGKIMLGGNQYRVIAVPPTRFMPVETLRRLADLVHKGARVIFLGEIPADVPGFKDFERRRAELKVAAEQISTEAGNGGGVMIAHGAAVSSLGLRREAMADFGLHCIRRVGESGDVSYFVVNDGDKVVDGWVPLASAGAYAELLDPATGAPAGRAALRNGRSRLEVYLQLARGDSLVILVRKQVPPNASSESAWIYRATSSARPITLDGRWFVHFLEGGPVLPADFSSDGARDWTDEADPENSRFAGTARYSTDVTLDPSAASDWLLTVPGLADSAQVRVNGTPVGTIWCRPFQISVGRFLKSGSNHIEIDVTNVAANRIRDLDRRHVAWKSFYEINFVNRAYAKFDASDWSIRPAGLSGAVTLVPETTKRLSP